MEQWELMNCQNSSWRQTPNCARTHTHCHETDSSRTSKPRSLRLIRPGLQNHVPHGSALANVGAEAVGLHLEFPNGVDWRLNDLEPDLLLVVVEPIQQKVVIRGRQPVCLHRAVPPLVFGNSAALHRA